MPKVYTLPKLKRKPKFFTLTNQSKRLFELGHPYQGYAGIVDGSNGHIHLLPAFNKDDGKLKSDKNGSPFKNYVESSQPLGKNTGDVHNRAVGLLKLGHKGGANGQLFGFGLFKGEHENIYDFRNRSASQNLFSIQYRPSITALANDALILKRLY